jgi:uncharacterized protein (TIGR00725 family)
MLLLERASGMLFDRRGRSFLWDERRWTKLGAPPVGETISPPEAVRWMQRESKHKCRVPIAVVGPRETGTAQLAAAEEVGRRIAGLGLTLLCGGRGGVMEAACRGAVSEGGISVGLLPDEDPAAANPYVTIPIAAGIGVARNALIARAALCLVAIGGGYGTISEIAFALQFDKPVFGLAGAPELRGVVHLGDAAAAEAAVACAVLALPVRSPAAGQ